MKKILVLLALTIAIGWGVFALAEEKKDDAKGPVDLKTRIERGEKRLAVAEQRMKANAELREEELQAAKHELANAKKLLADGKENEAQGALLKARHHAMFAMGRPHRPQMKRMMMRMHDGMGPDMGPRGPHGPWGPPHKDKDRDEEKEH